ncbi:MAG: PilZ domain-containing protein [Vicinamibacterales bacterium]
MKSERRAHKRLLGPFEGGWDGASGMRDCRITDLSRAGCFIDAYASNPVGASILTEVRLGGRVYRLRSEVVYVDRVQGFAVRFRDNDPQLMKDFDAAVEAIEA